MTMQAHERRTDGELFRRSGKLDKLLILIMALAALAVAGGFYLLRSGGGGTPKAMLSPFDKTTEPTFESVNTAGPLRPTKVGEFRGFSLQLQSGDASHPFEKYIDEIALTGANTICMVISAYQENGSSTSLFVEGRKTPSDERLKSLIDRAHQKGLRVVLMPIVLLDNPREGEWRGKINPTDWDAWWEHYNNYILHYAKLCEAAKVEVFILGSELVSTETQTQRWRGLIAEARKLYQGRLSYSANWDHYKPVKWWDDLDIVGMTTYYDLTGGKEAVMDTLLAAWKPIKAEILNWQAKVNRPLLFTEVGWPNQTTCAQYPWDYYRATDKPDPKLQADCFEAFFQTWIHEKAVAGFLVWEWRNHPGQAIGPSDTSYVPCGKPAMSVIRKYFQYPSPWQESQAQTQEMTNHGRHRMPTTEERSKSQPIRPVDTTSFPAESQDNPDEMLPGEE
jgi:hypothetical protein